MVNKPSSITQWRQFMTATYPTRTNRNWLISVGNHEQCVLLKKCRSGDGQAFRSYYSWPRNGYPGQAETWYYTDYQGVRFIVLDTFGGDLEPAVGLPGHGPEEQPSALDGGAAARRPVRLALGPQQLRHPCGLPADLREVQVDLVLSGHDHSYNRGYGGNKNSTVYAVSDSGQKFYKASRKDWTRGGATRVVSASQTATYQKVTVNQNTLVYRAVVGYKGKGSTTTKKVGQVLDRVTITKSGATKTVR